MDQHIDLERLRRIENDHPLWQHRLLVACDQGALGLDDFRYLFSQYELYSRSFTRYLAAVIAGCENEQFRARLAHNLWEEGGGCEPAKRHTELFRRFLRDGLALAPESLRHDPATGRFVRDYLLGCQDPDPVVATAFLALGTEGIVPRLYRRFVAGLRKAGVADPHLEFFHIHIECDDEHARTLTDLLLDYAERERWFERAARGLERALTLRSEFFDRVFERLREERVEPLLRRIQARASLADSAVDYRQRIDGGEPLYDNQIDRLSIQFSVFQMGFSAEVLDTRVVRVQPGKRSERHRHAHETIFYVVEGAGRVSVGERAFEVNAGDLVFVPRWCLHQSESTGASQLVILAVTDYGLTGKAYFGDYSRRAE